MGGGGDPRFKLQEDPIIHGVQDIIVGFSMLPRAAFKKEALETIPEILHPHNMEKLVRQEIEERFKPLPFGLKESVKRGCYNRKGQKIKILPKRDFDKLIDSEFSKHPNTLFVIFSGYVIDERYGQKVNEPVFMFKHAIFRYGEPSQIVKEITVSGIVSIDKDPKVIEKVIRHSLNRALDK